MVICTACLVGEVGVHVWGMVGASICRGACMRCYITLQQDDSTLGCCTNRLWGWDEVTSRGGCKLQARQRQWWAQGLVHMPDHGGVFDCSGALVNKSGDGAR